MKSKRLLADAFGSKTNTPCVVSVVGLSPDKIAGFSLKPPLADGHQGGDGRGLVDGLYSYRRSRTLAVPLLLV